MTTPETETIELTANGQTTGPIPLDEFTEQVGEIIADMAEPEQPELPQMPPTGPPSLKNLLALVQAVEKIYPSGDYSPDYQWQRFEEIADTAFRGGVRFVIPFRLWEAEQQARQEAAKAMAETPDCGACGSRFNTLDGSCTNADCGNENPLLADPEAAASSSD